MIILNDNILEEIDSEKLIYLNNLLSELALFKGENPLDAEAGIDYFGVFEGSAFLRVEIENVFDRHRANFALLSCGDITINDDLDAYKVDITAIFKDGETLKTALKIKK